MIEPNYKNIDKELRELILSVNDYTCSECGCKDKELELHHIIPRRFGGPNTPDNLIPVCIKCHRKIDPYNKGPRNYPEISIDKEKPKLNMIVRISKYGSGYKVNIPKKYHKVIDQYFVDKTLNFSIHDLSIL